MKATLVALLVSVVAACGGGASGPPTVRITGPADGEVVVGPAVHVTLAVSGIALAPVSEQRAGTAHHHLYLDVDLGSLTQPVPFGVPGVIHLGNAQSEFHWDSVAPGPHRIIALLADPAHLPLAPPAADTVRFTVAPR